eukprot:761704-Hanusia_phi.AAC.2
MAGAAEALKRFEVENGVKMVDGDGIYRFDAAEQTKMREQKPWTKDGLVAAGAFVAFLSGSCRYILPKSQDICPGFVEDGHARSVWWTAGSYGYLAGRNRNESDRSGRGVRVHGALPDDMRANWASGAGERRRFGDGAG